MNGGDQKACNAQGQATGDDLVLHLLTEGFENGVEHILILCGEGWACNSAEFLSESVSRM